MSEFNDLRKKYSVLREKLENGEIDEDAFFEKVSKLKLQDESGAWWQIDPDAGEWLKWDGKIWVKEPPPGSHSKGEPQKKRSPDSDREGQSSKAAGKRTSSEVFDSYSSGTFSIPWTNIFRQIFLNIFSRFKFIGAFSVCAFLFHTFIIAVGNDGFSKNNDLFTTFSNLRMLLPWYITTPLKGFLHATCGNFMVGSQIAIMGNETNALIGWTFGGGLVWLVISKVRQNGFLNSVKNLIGLPKAMMPFLRQSTNSNLAGLLFGIIFARWASSFLPAQTQNIFSFYSLAIMGSPLPFLFGGLVSNLSSWLSRKVPGILGGNFNPGAFSQVVFIGASSGFFQCAGWQYGPWLGWGLGIFAIYSILTGGNREMPVSPRVSFFLAIGMGGLAMWLGHDQMVFAHDKGWWENVNQKDPFYKQIINWIQSKGSLEVMQQGIPPSIGAGVGAAVTDATTKITTYILQVSTTCLNLTPDGPQEFMVAVWKCENGGAPFPAGDASIQISSGGGADWLNLSQTSGSCRLTCMVSQTLSGSSASKIPEPVTLYVTGSGGGQACSASVMVIPSGGPQYVLEVY